ncbi:hypothetical protein QWZ13_12890 [Reinekea marina]|uniref:hypothetical protein n=1 Tax=Reinekea marina TaxID=1310421 RepID=UPI0025B4DE9F|nr:hypothetical protein [Reinekea marina]MDN3649809.1 hypothetical protein [Reinekea marina]
MPARSGGFKKPYFSREPNKLRARSSQRSEENATRTLFSFLKLKHRIQCKRLNLIVWFE